MGVVHCVVRVYPYVSMNDIKDMSEMCTFDEVKATPTELAIDWMLKKETRKRNNVRQFCTCSLCGWGKLYNHEWISTLLTTRTYSDGLRGRQWEVLCEKLEVDKLTAQQHYEVIIHKGSIQFRAIDLQMN